MSLVARCAAVACVLVAAPAPAQDPRLAPPVPARETAAPAAQAAPAVPRPARDSAVSRAPRADEAAVGVRANEAAPAAPGIPRPAPTQENKTLMIVGFAGLLVGAIIGGDAGTILMVGGAVVGLYGLYKFLE